jgi:adenylate kinase family enzyme
MKMTYMDDYFMDKSKLGKRIMIIGSCGSGKTTLAIQLSKILKLPIIHLDKEYWKPGWVEPLKNEWEDKQNKLVLNDSWIIDGNYGGTFDIRFRRANTVIFLDYNKYVCLYRIIKRWIKNIGKKRADMADGCLEKIDIQFIKFVWEFPKNSRYKIIGKIDEYKDINKIILINKKQTKLFIEDIGKN